MTALSVARYTGAALLVVSSALGAISGCAPPPASPRVSLASVHAPTAAPPRAVSKGAALQRAPEEPSLDGRVLFRFRAGTPLVAEPAIGPDGSIYLATVDGYVHALYPDGRFHWSYTLVGGTLGAPVVDARGTLYVGTESGRVYSIRSNGTGFWTQGAPSSIVTALVRGAQGELYFGARDQRVFAVSPYAGAQWSVALGGWITAGPVVGPQRRFWFGTAGGHLVEVGGYSRVRVTALGGPILSRPVVAEDGSAFAVAGRRLVALGPDRHELWHRDGVRFVARSPRGVLVVCLADGALAWLGPGGAIERRAQLHAQPSAPPAVLADGRVVLATTSGRVLLLSRSGSLIGAERVGHAALLRPLADAARGRVIVTAGDGHVLALSAPARGAHASALAH